MWPGVHVSFGGRRCWKGCTEFEQLPQQPRGQQRQLQVCERMDMAPPTGHLQQVTPMLQVLEGLQDGQKLPQQLRGQQQQLQACGHMEAAVQALDVGRIAGAQHHLEAAEQCLGVSSEVTGITLSSMQQNPRQSSAWDALEGLSGIALLFVVLQEDPLLRSIPCRIENMTPPETA